MGGFAPLTNTATGGVSHWNATDGSAHTIANNVTTPFFDGFETYSSTSGRYNQSIQSGDLVYVDGNAASASYLVFSKSSLNAGTESFVESVTTFDMPAEFSLGLSMSQRTLGQDFAVEFVSTETSRMSLVDIPILNISQTTTTLTVNTTVAQY